MATRRHVIRAALAAAAMAGGRLAAQTGRPLRIVVPFGAGGIADLTARTVGTALGERLGQPVVVENRPGAGGVAAGEAVARAAPDGQTLLLMSNATAVSAGLFKRLPFDPVRDFAPVSLLGRFSLALLVPANSPWRTLGDLLAAARSAPGKLNIGTINVGSTQHLAAELFRGTAGLELQVVPFNGTPAVVTALVGGSIDAAVEILGPVRGQIAGGSLRPLAVLSDRRAAAWPAVPTVAESGGALARFDAASWNALAAPAGTPRERVLALNTQLKAVLADPAVVRRLAELDVEPHPGSPEQLGELLAAEIARWSGVIERAKIPRQ